MSFLVYVSLCVLQAIQQVNRDMNMLLFFLRPMKPAVAQLRYDLAENDEDLKRHLEDLLDHVVVLEEQVSLPLHPLAEFVCITLAHLAAWCTVC